MAKSPQPARSREPKGVGAAAAAERAAPAARGKPARSEARAEAPAVSDQRRPPEPMSESAPRALEPARAVPATPDPTQAPSAERVLAEPTRAQPAPAESVHAEPTTTQPAPAESAQAEPTTAQPAPTESAIREPAMAPPAEVVAVVTEPPPAPPPAVDVPPAPAAVAAASEPVAAAAGLALATAAMSWPGNSLVEGSIRIRSEMIAFTWRETEHGLALGRALLASRSLPEILALQTAYLGETLERTVAHSLELARLSTDVLRAGVPAPRAD